MRDRRNTNNLSISVSSQSSAAVSPISVTDNVDAEKGRFLLLPEKPISDALPSPLLKHAQETQRRQPLYRKAFSQASRQSIAVALLCSTFFLWRAVLLLSSIHVITLPSFSRYSLLEGTSLPEKPDPLIIQDQSGHKKWTISIPPNATFPLRPHEYKDICAKGTSLNKLLALADSSTTISDKYYHHDPLFVDPSSSSASKIFPTLQDTQPISIVGATPETATLPTCRKSLTFLLETSEAGFGASLLSLWLSYGLAQREGRAFFIDDSRWTYGSYITYFPAPPVPHCSPPPPQHIVPCPHSAAHLAVSAATLRETFGLAFHDHYQRNHHTGVSRQKDIFAMARSGYEALFGLNGEDREFASHRVRGIRDAAARRGQEVIGVHIRRGDRHPFEYEFQNDYLPLERFIDTAIESVQSSRSSEDRTRGRMGGAVLGSHILSAGPKKTYNESEPLTIYVGSDDPDIVTSKDLAFVTADTKFHLERAQERIVLASKNNLRPTVPERKGAFVKHIDQVSGWEGGFFSSLFRGLGRPNRAAHLTFSSAKEHREQVEERIRKEKEKEKGTGQGLSDEEKKGEENALAMRELVGRGYLLDLEVLGRSDRVVCAVSSATCRALGIVMGWDKVKDWKFVNVDDGRGWSWDGLH